ncbi:MAG: hypothetical protein F4018_12410 [Acidobacteria bacterium]|nr:hypothetical protein [Acidobacteriota bacterium]MYK89065.1 hypothetical protein [Acidobacteriota bacterium]
MVAPTSTLQLVTPPAKPLAPATAAGLRQVLNDLGTELRFNARSSKVEVWQGGDWQPLTERPAARLRERIAEHFDEDREQQQARRPLRFTDSRWRQAVHAVVDEIDPFREALEALPPWDGVPRLDHWLDTCFVLDPGTPPALRAWASRSVLLAAVWRACRPGTKHDLIVVLVGPQGVGKSSAFAWLFPPCEREFWFSDSLSLSSSERERVEALQGRVIVECAELAGATRVDLTRLKAFVSRTDDGGTRLAYRRDPEPRPRRAVIVGTTNDMSCLPNDSTGNRRFIPIAVTAGQVRHMRAWLDQHREQLWAEALCLYRAGEPAYLPDDLVETQARVTERYRDADDVVENRIDRWLDRSDLPEFFKVEDVAVEIGLVDQPGRLSRTLARRIRAALTLRGCVPARTRLDGARHPIRCYRRP